MKVLNCVSMITFNVYGKTQTISEEHGNSFTYPI